jgi:hypothetical protein
MYHRVYTYYRPPDGPPVEEDAIMCQVPEFPEVGHHLYPDAVDSVVGAMSDDSLRAFMSELLSAYLADAGDTSDIVMFERVMSTIPPPPPYCLVDREQVRATCAASAALCNMLIGPDRTEQAARLAVATITSELFDERIR